MKSLDRINEDHEVDCVDSRFLYITSLDPNMNKNFISSTIYSVSLQLQQFLRHHYLLTLLALQSKSSGSKRIAI